MFRTIAASTVSLAVLAFPAVAQCPDGTPPPCARPVPPPPPGPRLGEATLRVLSSTPIAGTTLKVQDLEKGVPLHVVVEHAVQRVPRGQTPVLAAFVGQAAGERRVLGAQVIRTRPTQRALDWVLTREHVHQQKITVEIHVAFSPDTTLTGPRGLRLSFDWAASITLEFPVEGAPTQAAVPARQGHVIAIDEAHRNTHTFSSPPFRGLVQLLQGDGYQVRPFADSMSSASLSGVDVLVLSNPGGWVGPEASLSDAEVLALIRWIEAGGALLLVLDHMPAPRNAARLTEALGVTSWHDGYAMVETTDSLIGNILFWQPEHFPAEAPSIGATGPGGGRGYQGPDAVLARHIISEGRTPEERVQRVATFTGSAFQPPTGAEALLTMPRRAVSLLPPITPGTTPTFTAETPRVSVGGWTQGAVMTIGRGRVAVFAETGLFSAGPAADNRRFVLNVLHWLSRLL